VLLGWWPLRQYKKQELRGHFSKFFLIVATSGKRSADRRENCDPYNDKNPDKSRKIRFQNHIWLRHTKKFTPSLRPIEINRREVIGS